MKFYLQFIGTESSICECSLHKATCRIGFGFSYLSLFAKAGFLSAFCLPLAYVCLSHACTSNAFSCLYFYSHWKVVNSVCLLFGVVNYLTQSGRKFRISCFHLLFSHFLVHISWRFYLHIDQFNVIYYFVAQMCNGSLLLTNWIYIWLLVWKNKIEILCNASL